MSCYVIEIPGTPTGKGRPRATTRGKSRIPVMYTPAKTKAAEDVIIDIAVAGEVSPINGPVRMVIKAIFPIAKSWTKARKAAALAGAPHLSKPDGDNVAKLVCDALNGLAYADDARVFDLRVVKTYGPEAKTMIFIYGGTDL
jgi:Holliday junction resolvase RusA-like endonuclease